MRGGVLLKVEIPRRGDEKKGLKRTCLQGQQAATVQEELANNGIATGMTKKMKDKKQMTEENEIDGKEKWEMKEITGKRG